MSIDLGKVAGFINEINKGNHDLPESVLTIEGHSSKRVRSLLNKLVSLTDNYLEVGIHVGSTLIPAAYGNDHALITGIDNWTLAPVWGGGDRREDLWVNIRTHLGDRDINIIDHDCFSVDLDLIPPNVGVYFYDGDHSRESQYKAFTYFYPVLAERFVAVVDDYNWIEPREATQKAIADLNLVEERSWHLPARTQRDEELWWNGLFVAVLRKSK